MNCNFLCARCRQNHIYDGPKLVKLNCTSCGFKLYDGFERAKAKKDVNELFSKAPKVLFKIMDNMK